MGEADRGVMHGGTQRHPLDSAQRRALAKDPRAPGALDRGECFIDSTLSWQKRGPGVGTTKRGTGTKLMAVADRTGLPLAVRTASASPPEVTRVPDTVAASFTP